MYRPIFEIRGAEEWEDEEKDWWNREVTIGNDSPLRHLRVPVGGEATKDLSSLAAEYHNAAEVLIHTIRAEPPTVIGCGNVLLYLYRHSIELLLKDIIPAEQRKRDHEFSQLAARFKVSMRREPRLCSLDVGFFRRLPLPRQQFRQARDR